MVRARSPDARPLPPGAWIDVSRADVYTLERVAALLETFEEKMLEMFEQHPQKGDGTLATAMRDLARGVVRNYVNRVVNVLQGTAAAAETVQVTR